MAKKTQKQSRKELLKSDDAFIQAANTGAEWLTENRTWVAAAVIAVLAVVAGVLFAGDSMRTAAALDAETLAEAVAIHDAEVVPEADADAGAEPPTFATEDARRSAALAAFKPLVGDTGTGLVARFYYAALLEESGDDEGATSEFDALLAHVEPSDTLYFLALERAAYAHERRGNVDRALELWGRLTSGKAFYSDRASFHRARLTEARGEKERAAALYQELEEAFPESGVLETAKNRLALLEEQGITPPKPEAAEPEDESAAEPEDESEAAAP